jgi:type I restriction enzyme M protein
MPKVKTKSPVRYPEHKPSVMELQEALTSVLPKPKRDAKGRLECPLMNNGAGGWREPKPEELVRQAFILHLHHHYGYAFEQMLDEQKTQHGRKSPKADIAIWDTPAARNTKPRQSPKIVVECKAENVSIHPKDFFQGESYGRASGAEFLVMHNERQTAFFRIVPGLPGELVPITVLPKASDWSDENRIEEIKKATRAFSREEFRDLLFRCHCILRDVHKMPPDKAFDTFSKILFVKMYIERTGTWGTFTTDFLRQRDTTRLPTDEPVHVQLFEQTKKFYATDDLFSKDDKLEEISDATFYRIVNELARFNLSATGDDVKGIAFEKFLGDTFRGELGQYFTPRSVVDFMVQLLDPQERQLVCDPCSGSGGFLIRAFEHVRNNIEADVQAKKDAARKDVESLNLPEEKEVETIAKAFATLNLDVEPEQKDPPSRIYRLAHDYIFGTDAESRAARTSKMNMIMHGDGHGGIHYHDGLLDINGVFPDRFDLVFTNPPFGSNVGDDQKVGATEQSRVPESNDYVQRCRKRYGDDWEASHKQMTHAAMANESILNLFEIGKDKPNRPTEIVFVERCLQLLKPGGRLGIVLPDGNLNNPSLGWLRRWAEGKAKLLAVVSLPEETFKSSDASVKASLVFLKRFTTEDEAAWETAWQNSHAKFDAGFNTRRGELCAQNGPAIISAGDARLAKLIKELSELGVERTLPAWRLKPPPPYPRGVVQTEIIKPRWEGTAEGKDDKAKAKKLRAEFETRWTEEVEERAADLLRELRAALRKVDREQFRALWQEVRTMLDYPVFTAAPEEVGITSTGAQGPDQLPDVLAAYRQFAKWVNAGAKENQRPAFA